MENTLIKVGLWLITLIVVGLVVFILRMAYEKFIREK